MIKTGTGKEREPMREMPAIHGRNPICIGIDCVMGRDYSGRIWHRYQTEPIPFSTSMELIQKMDELYDGWIILSAKRWSGGLERTTRKLLRRSVKKRRR